VPEQDQQQAPLPGQPSPGQQSAPGQQSLPGQPGQQSAPGQRPHQHVLDRLRQVRWSGGALRRRREGRVLGGVAAALADRTGIDVTVIRCVFVVTALVSGFGAVPYVIAWLAVPGEGEQSSIAGKAVTDRRGITLAVGLGSLLVVLLLIGSALGAPWLGSLATPLVISFAGAVLIWRNAPQDEQDTLRRYAEPVLGLAEPGMGLRSRGALRMPIALLLLGTGLVILLADHPSQALLRPLTGVVLVIAAIVVVLAPWWLGIARDLVTERQARARAEERADMAARVHDSVLQTLALIQRRAEDPQQVVQLARAQERELRSWLFDGRAPGSLDQATTLAAGIRQIQQEVEAQHGIAVEAVTVGDCELDEDLTALLAAAREATVNARWSRAGCRCTCAIAAGASTRRPCPRTARGWPSPCMPG
jgi:phage shock protein PspC (stress-responsive transcriptional regulator)